MPLPPVPFEDVDVESLVRVDVPDYPGALLRSASGAVLAAPPADGTPWRRESVGQPDVVVVDPGPVAPGDPAVVTNAAAWHAAGWRGQGVKVAVFDSSWFGADVDPAAAGDPITHDCVVSPSCEAAMDPLASHFDIESGVHGWGCAETVHRVAPDAEIHLVRAGTLTLLEDAVAWAIREHVDVITMSLSFYTDSFHDGTGPHHDLLVRLEDAGILMVTSAGNDAEVHWGGRWQDLNADGWLDGDADDGVALYLPDDSSVTLVWNQFGSCGATDLSARLLDADGIELSSVDAPQVAGGSEDGEACVPVEKLSARVRGAGWTKVQVHRERGPVVGLEVQLFAHTGQFANPMALGAVVDPQADPLSAAVAAVRAAGYLDNEAESFSSWGPNAVGDPRPDLAGPDGLDTHAFGPVGFYGTSAASPAVAGLVALELSRDPSLTPREAFERLQGAAIGVGATVFAPDPSLGAGRARLPVPDPEPAPCGRRALWMMLPPVGVWPWRRRWTSR